MSLRMSAHCSDNYQSKGALRESRPPVLSLHQYSKNWQWNVHLINHINLNNLILSDPINHIHLSLTSEVGETTCKDPDHRFFAEYVCI